MIRNGEYMFITKKQARLYLLMYQDLLKPRTLTGKQGILTFMKKVGSIQFDPLSVIDLHPNLVLQSRINDYQASDLNELLYKDRLLIDDWDKNQCIYRVEDWPYFQRYRNKDVRIFSKEDLSENKMLEDIKTLIKDKGPVSSLDLDYNDKVNWFWQHTKLSKVALESMYYWGELVIHHKVGVRKYYDLTTSVLPQEIHQMVDPNKTKADFYSWVIKRRIGSVGILWNKASDAYLGIFSMKTKERQQAFQTLIENKEIIEVEVEDIGYPLYIRKDAKPILDQAINGVEFENDVRFIAPLDNFLWDRKLIKALFDFEYTWEVYKPKSEREYGYYVLPVLYGEQFIARFEPRFEKSTKTLQILNWWWEKNVNPTPELLQKIDNAISQFGAYLQSSNILFICDLKKKYD